MFSVNFSHTTLTSSGGDVGVKELKKTIDDAGLSHADCFEKPELRKRATEALAKGTGNGDGGGDGGGDSGGGAPPAPPPKDVHKRKGGGGGFLGRALSFRSKGRSPSMNRQDSLSFQAGDLETTGEKQPIHTHNTQPINT